MFKRLLATAAVLVVILAVAAFFAFNTYVKLLEPVDLTSERQVIVEIPPGANTDTIAAILFDHGLIQNPQAFRLYVRLHDLGQGFIAGSYSLGPAMSAEEIAFKIQSGAVYTETAWFTVPEGLTVEEIARRLAGEGLVESSRFLELARRPSPALIEAFPFLAAAGREGVIYALEGYLFPDTYEVYSDARTEDIIALMIRRLEQVLDEEGWDNTPEGDYTLHQLLTMASLVEREGRVDHERSLIAGVFYNRLREGWLLESCATVQYLLDEPKEILLYEDLEIPSPYNTYRYPGLPPGPIGAPGKASIRAALNPAQTDYYFFNYRHDGSGEHYFSRTLEEHNRNRRKAEANLP